MGVFEMTTLWIIIGCLFMTAIGIRFVYRFLGLSKTEATIIYVLILFLILINSAPIREFVARVF